MAKPGRPAKNPIKIYPNRLRALREERELSQAEVARRIGVRPQTVQRYETGERQLKLPKAQQIAKAIGVHVAELLAPGIARTTEEADLLKLFRKLGPAGRSLILDQAHKLVEQFTELQSRRLAS